MDSKDLIIESYRYDIIESIKNNQVVMIRGQCGCGKSTQVPQYIATLLKPDDCLYVLLRQSEVVKANSEFMDKTLKNKIRIGHYSNNDRSNVPNPQIIYIINGLFLRWIGTKNISPHCSYIIFDDIDREKSSTVVILEIMKKWLNEKPGLRIILMSSCLDVKFFTNYYSEYSCKLIDISRGYSNVEIIYLPINKNEICYRTSQKVIEIFQSANDTVSILVCASNNRIDNLYEQLNDIKEKKLIPSVEIKVCKFKMTPKDKNKALKNSEGSKIILATDAVMGLKIPSLKYVIDIEFTSVIAAEKRKGILGRVNDNAKCFRFYENPFLVSFPKVMRRTIDEKISCFTRKLNMDLLLEVFESRTEFFNKFISDLSNYFENSIDLPEDKSDIMDTYCINSLRQILSLIFPNENFSSYEAMMKFIIKLMADDKKFIEPTDQLALAYTIKKIYLFVQYGINSFDRTPFINKQYLELGIERLLNLSIIQEGSQGYQLTSTGYDIRFYNHSVYKSKVIYLSQILLFENKRNYFEEICFIILLGSSNLIDKNGNEETFLISCLNVMDEMKKNPNDEKFQSDEAKYFKMRLNDIQKNRVYKQRNIAIPHSITRNVPDPSFIYIKWLLMSGFIYNIAIKIPNDPENRFYIVYSDSTSKLEGTFQEDSSIILFMKGESNDFSSCRSFNSIKMEYNEIAEFPAKEFEINESFWNGNLQKIKNFLQKNKYDI